MRVWVSRVRMSFDVLYKPHSEELRLFDTLTSLEGPSLNVWYEQIFVPYVAGKVHMVAWPTGRAEVASLVATLQDYLKKRVVTEEDEMKLLHVVEISEATLKVCLYCRLLMRATEGSVTINGGQLLSDFLTPGYFQRRTKGVFLQGGANKDVIASDFAAYVFRAVALNEGSLAEVLARVSEGGLARTHGTAYVLSWYRGSRQPIQDVVFRHVVHLLSQYQAQHNAAAAGVHDPEEERAACREAGCPNAYDAYVWLQKLLSGTVQSQRPGHPGWPVAEGTAGSGVVTRVRGTFPGFPEDDGADFAGAVARDGGVITPRRLQERVAYAEKHPARFRGTDSSSDTVLAELKARLLYFAQHPDQVTPKQEAAIESIYRGMKEHGYVN